jgi:hypothetical protein
LEDGYQSGKNRNINGCRFYRNAFLFLRFFARVLKTDSKNGVNLDNRMDFRTLVAGHFLRLTLCLYLFWQKTDARLPIRREVWLRMSAPVWRRA